jgi:hypothetical protein
VIRTANRMDADAVSILLETSYSLLLASSYDSNMLKLALPYMVKANPALLVSGITERIEPQVILSSSLAKQTIVVHLRCMLQVQ